MLLVRLLLVFVLAIGVLPARSDAMASAQPAEATHQTMDAVDRCGEPCQTPTHGQAPQDHCQAMIAACCIARVPDMLVAVGVPAFDKARWQGAVSPVPAGLDPIPATPPPRT